MMTVDCGTVKDIANYSYDVMNAIRKGNKININKYGMKSSEYCDDSGTVTNAICRNISIIHIQERCLHFPNGRHTGIQSCFLSQQEHVSSPRSYLPASPPHPPPGWGWISGS